MKLKSVSIAVIIFVVLFGGIGLAKLSGYWKTESVKIPVKIKTGEFAGEYNSEDIRGSYRLSDIVEYFEIPLEDLQKAFGLLSDKDAANFQCKELKEKYAFLKEEGKEIGTGSVKFFVALYKGLPYSLSEDTYLPLSAVDILKEKANLSDEQMEYIEEHCVDISNVSKSVVEKDETSTANNANEKEETENILKGKTTFSELIDLGLTKEKIEEVIGYSINDLEMKIRDYCVEKGLEFSDIKIKLQKKI